MKINLNVQGLCYETIRGIATYEINLLKALTQRNRFRYEITFFDYKKERGNLAYVNKHFDEKTLSKLDILECNSVNFKDIKNGCSVNDFSKFAYATYKEIIGSSSDVFHIPDSSVIPLNASKNLVVTVHDIMPVIYKGVGYWDKETERAFNNSHRFIAEHKNIQIIAVSRQTKHDLIEYYGIDGDRIDVVPEACDISVFYEENNTNVLRNLGINQPYLLYLGALDARKGIIDIWRAYERIARKYPEVKMVMAGRPYMNFQKYIDKYRKEREGVIYTGYVDEVQKRVLLSMAEAFVFPSEYEGFGLPVLEAMACGTPVIASNSSSLPEVGGDAVLYVKPNNNEELEEKMDMILSDSNLRKSYKDKGFKQCKKFSWDKTAELTEQVYQRAIDMN